MPSFGDEQDRVPDLGEHGGWVCGSPGSGPDAAGAGQGTVLGAGSTAEPQDRRFPAEVGVGSDCPPPPHHEVFITKMKMMVIPPSQVLGKTKCYK